MISSSNKRGKRVSFKRNNVDEESKLTPVKKSRLKINVPVMVIALVFVYLAISLGGEVQKLNAMRHHVAEIEQQVETLQVKNEELHSTLELLKSNDYVEQVARENLGLVKPGESIIVPIDEQSDDSLSQTIKIRDPNIKD